MVNKVLTAALLLEGPALLVSGFPHIAEMVAKQKHEKRKSSLTTLVKCSSEQNTVLTDSRRH